MNVYLLYSIRSGILLVFLAPLLVPTGTFQTFFPFIVGKSLFSRAIIEIVFGLWIILIFRYPEHRPRRSYLVIALTVYVFVTVLTGVTGVSWHRSLWSSYERMQGIIDLTHWLGFVLVVSSTFRSRIHWHYIINFNLAVSLIVAMLGLAQYFDANVPVYTFLRGSPRLDITLGNATFVGTYMLINTLLALGLLAQSFSRNQDAQVKRQTRHKGLSKELSQHITGNYWRTFWVTAIILDFTILWLSGSRGAILALMVGILFIASCALFTKLPSLKRPSVVTIIILFILAFMYGITVSTGVLERISPSSLTLQRFAAVSSDDLSIKGRLTSVSTGINGFLDRPVFGWGPENFGIVWARNFDAESGITETFDQAHNKPIEELATKGIIGFLSYLAVWIVAAIIFLRILKKFNSSQAPLTLFLGGALVAYFVQNLFLFDTPVTAMQFYLLISYFVYLEIGGNQPQQKPSRSRLQIQPVQGVQIWNRDLPIYGLMTVLILLVLFGVSLGVFVNYRTFIAAQAAARVFSEPDNWDTKLSDFRESIDSFQPLANYPRHVFFDQLDTDWHKLSLRQKSAAIAMVEIEAEDMFKSEPKTWIGRVKLADLYLTISNYHPEYLPAASFYVDQARLAAPKTHEVYLLEQKLSKLNANAGIAK